jgi:hypothetical protein
LHPRDTAKKEAIVIMRLAIVVSILALYALLACGCDPAEGQPRKYPDSTDTGTDTGTESASATDTGT